MYKYDWLETQSGLSRKEARRRIPWDELLAEEKETLGPRDFKSFKGVGGPVQSPGDGAAP